MRRPSHFPSNEKEVARKDQENTNGECCSPTIRRSSNPSPLGRAVEKPGSPVNQRPRAPRLLYPSAPSRNDVPPPVRPSPRACRTFSGGMAKHPCRRDSVNFQECSPFSLLFVRRVTSQAIPSSPLISWRANLTWSASKCSRTDSKVLLRAALKLGSGTALRKSAVITVASPYRFISLSTRSPKRQAKETRVADSVIVVTNELPSPIRFGLLVDHEEGRIKSENKKAMQAHAVRRAPLKPHLNAAARTTNR